MEKIELLSPAGDLEKLRIAYLYGADACYIGGKDYSLRANANNFSTNEIKEAVSFAHNLGKKIYVTLNIIFHNEDLEGVTKYLKELSKANVDAVIISDVFLIDIIKKETPDLKIFLSTQDSVTNKESVKYFMDKGVSRVVLARELTKDEIKEIYDETKCELEIFLHGAMCTSYSGRCVLSNYFTNRDSNRGGCCQVCRFCFNLDKDKEPKFQIATKDLNLSKFIKDLIEINVTSLKVEGRMRGTYYLATVNSCYRNLIDAYYSNNQDEKFIERNIKLLNRVSNRESSSQYFKGYVDYNDQYYNGRLENSNQDFLAQVIDYDKNTKEAIIEQRNYFKKGDIVNLFGPGNIDIDFKIEYIKDKDNNLVDIANHPKEVLKIKVPQEVTKDFMIRVKM